MNDGLKSWTKALEGGFQGFLAFLLTSALFASPALASHQSFAHLHPKGTPFHLHAISTFFSAEAVSAQTTPLPSYETLGYLHPFTTSLFLKAARIQANGTRAPPSQV